MWNPNLTYYLPTRLLSSWILLGVITRPGELGTRGGCAPGSYWDHGHCRGIRKGFYNTPSVYFTRRP